ncbi:UDP-glucuronosyltransferase 2B31-like [Megalops cyprinoides]|uniref:UDP-glucuronosyltransferase 2B31-like n=1 Tax=Megalops cyprinoides TaxID=118141 RepID=UPI0018655C0C|nr:UDP-glucuronosyltransferase 2B31-like [Megalops cyprinoides]
MKMYSPWSLAFILLITQLMLFGSVCYGGKVLVIPLEGSHWVNMDILIRGLHARGHTVTVIRSDKSWYIKEKSQHYSSITVPVSAGIDEDFVKTAIRTVIEIERGKSSLLNFLLLQKEMFHKMSEAHRMVINMAVNIFEDKNLIKTLKESQYDLMLTDPAWGSGILVAHYLNIPLVYNVRWVTSGEGHFAITPSPISYIPMTGSGLSDKMTFVERVKNMLFYGLMLFQDRFLIRPIYQAVCDQYFDAHVDFYELLQAADIWLMRVDFVFEFPRPTMPNVVYMGGFQCKSSKPLPEDLEEFVQSSGEHGIIIMSLGTFVGHLPHGLADEIAAAFAQLPQKVIWRYTGDRPVTLGNNTRLVNWMPQNDLLGHPKTRVFVAHGGTNGVLEAIYHGVPVVGLPLFYDQYDNLLRLKERGGATILSVGTVDSSIFFQALQEVLHDPSYRMNMQRLSRLHRDQPMKPLDLALFWIEFVMRHKGAAHLRTESYKMPWYVYHSVDVIAVLLALMLLILIIVIAVIRYLCCRLCCKRKIKHD